MPRACFVDREKQHTKLSKFHSRSRRRTVLSALTYRCGRGGSTQNTPRSRHSLRSGPTKSTHLIRFQYSTQFPRLVKSLDGVDTLEREKEGKKIVKRRHLMSATFNPFAGSLSFRLRRVSSSCRVAVKGACTRGLASASRKFTWSDPRKIRQASGLR